ncbi:hypothetical protein EDD22DRAFT_961391 [Suillus occidentalis]|nr:hypothetical protein EDD22DRAFT_961391 [Suillus occidentalis]
MNGDAEEVVEVEEDELVEDELEDEETIPEASMSHPPPIPQKDVPALQDPAAWEILERFLTMDTSYGQTEDDFAKYLGSRHRLLDWTEAWLALFSGNGNDQVSLANFLKLKCQHLSPPSTSKSSTPRSHLVKNPFVDLKAKLDDDDDELEDDEEYTAAMVTHLPARRHDLSETIARIEVNATSGGSASAPRPPYIPRKCMYLFTVNVPARQYLADHMEKQGFSIMISPDFPYDMPKGSVTLFDLSCLPPSVSTTNVILDGEVVTQKYKGEDYYNGLLKKTFHQYSTELVHTPHPNDIWLHH